MRTAAQLALLLLGCACTCFVASLFQPVTISGTAINVLTGKPMPYVRILFRHLNSSTEAAIADAHGNFTAYSDRASYCCTLYAGYPQAGTLLQAVLSSAVHPLLPGEHFAGVTLYAVPGTELPGHVYDEDSNPLSGCQVEGVTGARHRFGARAWIGWAVTDAAGAFQLSDLGTDRYLAVAQCKGWIAGSPPIGAQARQHDSEHGFSSGQSENLLRSRLGFAFAPNGPNGTCSFQRRVSRSQRHTP